MTDVAVAAPRRAGAAEGFLDLYAETRGRITAYAFQLVGDADLATEIAQEAYTRLLARWVAVRKPRPYLFHVVTNLAKDTWESRDRTADVLRVLRAGVGHDEPAPDTSVRDAVARLPRRHREVVLLYYYADLPLPEVAAAVRRPAGTVKRLLAEARAHLAEALGENR